tara:strand:- start:28418 stop:30829 length:2412 start_codon:yes stop_codon:yes gene_type:complete
VRDVLSFDFNLTAHIRIVAKPSISTILIIALSSINSGDTMPQLPQQKIKCLVTSLWAALMLSPVAAFAADAEQSRKELPYTAPNGGLVSGYDGYVSLGGGYGSDQNSSGGADVFQPLWQQRTALAFVDVRGFDGEASVYGGSLGFGYRQMLQDESWLFGGYSYFDTYNSKNNNNFNQITFGGEAKTLNWSILANGYMPIGSTDKRVKGDDIIQHNALGNNQFSVDYAAGYESSMYGFNTEVGYRIVDQLRVYGGGFYFTNTNTQALTGPTGRLEYQWDNPFQAKGVLKEIFNRFTFETSVQYDGQRGLNWYAGMRMRVGLGEASTPHAGLARHMTDRVQRIQGVTVSKKDYEALAHVTNTDGSTKTFSIVNNAAELKAQLAAGGADVVGVNGGISDVDNTLVMQDGQFLTGGSYDYQGYDITLGNAGSVSASGTLVQAVNEGLIQVGKNNTIENLTIVTNPGATAISNSNGGSVGTLNINHVSAQGTGGVSLMVTDGSTDSNITIDNNTFGGSRFNLPDITGGGYDTSLPTQGVAGIIVLADGSTVNVNSINNNNVTVAGSTANEMATGIYTYSYGENANFTINSINSNTVLVTNTGLNASSIGIAHINRGESSTINTINGNTIGVYDSSATSTTGAAISSVFVRSWNDIVPTLNKTDVTAISNNTLTATSIGSSVNNLFLESRDFDVSNTNNNSLTVHAVTTNTFASRTANINDYDVWLNSRVVNNGGTSPLIIGGTKEGEGFYGNNFTGTNPTNVLFESDFTDAAITMYVNDGKSTIGEANNGAVYRFSGNGGTITIHPTP